MTVTEQTQTPGGKVLGTDHSVTVTLAWTHRNRTCAWAKAGWDRSPLVAENTASRKCVSVFKNLGAHRLRQSSYILSRKRSMALHQNVHAQGPPDKLQPEWTWFPVWSSNLLGRDPSSADLHVTRQCGRQHSRVPSSAEGTAADHRPCVPCLADPSTMTPRNLDLDPRASPAAPPCPRPPGVQRPSVGSLPQ